MSSDTLVRITALANALRAAQADVASASETLAEATKRVFAIEMEDLPELMKELSVASIELEDGSKVAVLEDLKVGISEANREAAHEWVKARGDGGIIKIDVGLAFGKGEAEEAEALVGKIRQMTNRPIDVAEAIHHSTLKSYVKELREKGVTVPLELFGLHIFNKAKLTPPKQKKAKQSKVA